MSVGLEHDLLKDSPLHWRVGARSDSHIVIERHIEVSTLNSLEILVGDALAGVGRHHHSVSHQCLMQALLVWGHALDLLFGEHLCGLFVLHLLL